MTRAEFLALAERVERAEGADGILDADILAATHPELSHPQWERVTYPNGRWAFYADRSDPDGLNIVHTPAFTASLDAALREIDALGGPFIAQMGDIAADGLPGVCLCVSTDPVKHVWGIGHGHDYIGRLARATIAAALRARAEEAKDE